VNISHGPRKNNAYFSDPRLNFEFWQPQNHLWTCKPYAFDPEVTEREQIQNPTVLFIQSFFFARNGWLERRDTKKQKFTEA